MKKSLKSISFWLVILTTILSIIFVVLYNNTDPILSSTLKTIFHYLEAGFSSLSLFVCYGIIIYSYARYTPDKAKFSFIYLAINVFSCWFIQTILTLSSPSFQDDMAAERFELRPTLFYLTNICSALGKIFIEQILPAILIAFIVYKLTKNGSERVTKFISWKNSIQRSMIISTIIIFLVNIALSLILNIFPYLISEAFFITFEIALDALLDIIFSIIETIAFSLILQYSVYMLIYFICNKYGETNGLTQKTINRR